MRKHWRAFVDTHRPPGPGVFHSSWAFCLASFSHSCDSQGRGCGESPGAGATREAGREQEVEAVPAVPQQLAS